jgi:hypothetical protein
VVDGRVRFVRGPAFAKISDKVLRTLDFDAHREKQLTFARTRMPTAFDHTISCGLKKSYHEAIDLIGIGFVSPNAVVR